MISGTITDINHRDDVVIRIRELRQRQEQLQARRIEIESQMSDRKVELADLETVSCYVDDLHNLLKEGTLAERRAFIRSFVKEVKVTGGEAVLNYSMPILPEKIAIDKEGVLPTVQYGGRYCTIGRTFELVFCLT